MELEEERRLFYVGVTRARKLVCLSTATTRYRFGEVESLPSRFLKEIPKELIETVDARSYRRPAYVTGSSESPSLFPRKQAPKPTGVHYDFGDTQEMETGRIVQHPTFGRGKVVSVEGFGDSLRLEIVFTGIGLKKIMAKYARLKIVG